MLLALLALLAISHAYIFEADEEEEVAVPEGANDEILNSHSFADAYDKYMKTYYKKSVSVNSNFGAMSPEMQKMVVQEEATRARTFIKNVRMAKKHNLNYEHGLSSYVASVNKFSVMGDEERHLHLGIAANISEIASTQEECGPVSRLIRSNTPKEVDWLKKGYVVKPKNQGSCGSCWAYSAMVSVEYVYKAASGNLIPLSEQELVDCSYPESQNGCQGGFLGAPMRFLARSKHLPKAADYAYVGRDNRCQYKSHPNAFEGMFSSLAEGRKDNPGVAGMTALIAQNGPISIVMHVTNSFFSFKSGVYQHNCGSLSPNHGMAITGYTSSFFMVRNSWGAHWGEGGYFKCARSNVCSILSYAFWLKFQVDPKYKKKVDPDSEVVPGADRCKERKESSKRNTHCDILALEGGCQKKKSFMVRYCADTCGFCNGADDDGEDKKKGGKSKEKKKKGKGKKKKKKGGKGQYKIVNV